MSAMSWEDILWVFSGSSLGLFLSSGDGHEVPTRGRTEAKKNPEVTETSGRIAHHDSLVNDPIKNRPEPWPDRGLVRPCPPEKEVGSGGRGRNTTNRFIRRIPPVPSDTFVT